MGKSWQTPWSVMAMAGWPQAAARWITFLMSVVASMEDILVCKWSSTRFFPGAVSVRSGGRSPSAMPVGSIWSSPW